MAATLSRRRGQSNSQHSPEVRREDWRRHGRCPARTEDAHAPAHGTPARCPRAQAIPGQRAARGLSLRSQRILPPPSQPPPDTPSSRLSADSRRGMRLIVGEEGNSVAKVLAEPSNLGGTGAVGDASKETHATKTVRLCILQSSITSNEVDYRMRGLSHRKLCGVMPRALLKTRVKWLWS